MGSSEFILADICAGTGMLGEGVRIALETIGIRSRVGLFCEWETCAAASILARMETAAIHPAPIWCGDIREFESEPWRGCSDILTAGYPCQPFSSAGKRLGRRDPRHLWPAVRRIVARLKPGLVFLENVDGHVTLGLWKVLRDLERLGFDATCGVFSAEEVGAPHLRKRVFVLGISDADQQRRAELRAEQPQQHRQPKADAERVARRSEQQHDQRGRQGSESSYKSVHGGGGETLANGPGERRPGDAQPHLRNGSKPTRRGDVERCSIDLGDAQRIGRKANDGCEREQRPAEGCVSLFPPHRDDYGRWADLATAGLDPTLMPAIESGFPVVADGLASPADLLRLGGNGVVPLQAAWAFLQLACCLGCLAPEVETQLGLFD